MAAVQIQNKKSSPTKSDISDIFVKKLTLKDLKKFHKNKVSGN